MRTRIATLLIAAAALGGCGYNGVGLGVGYGSGYGGYGNVGYGYGNGYYDPYYSGGYGGGYGSYGGGYGGYGGYAGYGGGYGGYGGGYGSPYWGWNDGFYYPGSGHYIYDRYRNRQVWTDAQRRYWTQRLQQAQSNRGVTKMPNTRLNREIWNDFNRPPTGTTTVTNQGVARSPRGVRSQSVTTTRPSRSERVQQREERRVERQSARSTNASERRRNRED